MSWEQEQQLIESFKEKARKGHIATAKEIKLAYEQKIGYQVHKTTTYRLLKRHQWHKVVTLSQPSLRRPPSSRRVYKNFAALVEQINRTREPKDTRLLLLMAADEGKFGRIGEFALVGVPKATDQLYRSNQVRQYFYAQDFEGKLPSETLRAYTAVAPALGQISCLILPHANTKERRLTSNRETNRRSSKTIQQVN